MKYAYPEIDGFFDFENGMINTLIIENPHFFKSILTDFHLQISGEEGKGVLSVSDSPVDMSKYAEMIDSFVPFEINRKNLLTKITSALEKRAVAPERYEETMRFLGEAEKYLDGIAFDFPCDIVFSKVTVGNIIKSVSPEIRDDYTNLCEKILDYFELVCEFDRPKLFILINLRSYIDDADFELFSKSVISHAYQVLMIENRVKNKIKEEKRLIIDEDLCEIR